MVQLYGREMTRAELSRHVGDVSQVARVKPYRLAEGFEEGVLAVDVTTGSGLDFTVLPSRGMDLSSASYKGKSLCWRSATTDKHPAYFEPEERGWLRSFYGGLMVTCGLCSFGAHCTDEGVRLGIHGRVSHLPATNVSWDGWWEGDSYLLEVRGKLREAVVFGENIELTRTIRSYLGATSLTVHDTVTNIGYHTTPHMVLYHINVGFPAVAAGSRLVAPTISVDARDEDAMLGAADHNRFDPPTHAYREKAYSHTMRPDANGHVTAAIVNETCEGGYAVWVTYNHNELPHFTQWKMMDEGTYVVGMEPCNALVLGRDVERREGRLKFIEPGETKEYHLEIGVAEGAAALQALVAKCAG